jgi:hypothetical protein
LAKARRTKPYMSGSWNQASERRCCAAGCCMARRYIGYRARLRRPAAARDSAHGRGRCPTPG